jgi:hypothetical protein
LSCEHLEDRLLLTTLPIYATFDQTSWVGATPPSGDTNQPSAVIVPIGGTATVKASAFGITTQPTVISDASSGHYGSLDFDFDPISTGSLRADVTVAFSRLVDGTFLEVGDGQTVFARLHMSSSGQITDDSFSLLGNYQANRPFGVRVTVSPAASSMSVAVDDEMDGFSNDSPFTGLLYSGSEVSKFSACLSTTVGSAAASVAYDNVKISTFSDLIVSKLLPTYYDSVSGKLQYQYTVMNVGDSPANIEGATSAATDNVMVTGILSSNSVLGDSDDVPAGSAPLYGDRAGLLEAGQSTTGQIDVSASVTGSSPYLFLQVDSTGIATESDETNNITRVQIPKVGSLPVLATFTQDTVGALPASGGLNEPTVAPAVPAGTSILVKSESCGLKTQVAEFKNNTNATASLTSSLTYGFDSLWTGTLRIEATVSFDALAASIFFQTLDPFNAMVTRLSTTTGGLIIDNENVTVGSYAANTPMRIRMDIDLQAQTWTYTQDEELNGFADDKTVTGRPYDTTAVTQINRFQAMLYTAAASPVTTLAYDDIVITRPDLVISNLRAVNYTNDYIEYQYTITNNGGAPANLNGVGVSANEVQQLTFSPEPNAGSYTITFDPDGIGGGIAPQTTGVLNFNFTAAQVQSALSALSTIGGSNVLVTGTLPLGFTITFVGSRGEANLLDSVLTVNTTYLTRSGSAVTATVSTLVDGHGVSTTLDDVKISAALSSNAVFGDVDDVPLTTLNLAAASANNAIVLNPGESYTGFYRSTAAIDTAAYPYLAARVGCDTTNEEQQLVFSPVPTAGTYALTFDRDGLMGAASPTTTASLSYSATAAQVQAALSALSTVGSGNVLVTGSYTSGFRFTFVGSLGAQPLPDAMLSAKIGSLTPTTSATVTTVVDGYSVPTGMEISISNNTATSVMPTNGTIDLRGTLSDVSRGTWGGSLAVQFVVSNSGTAVVDANIAQKFYLSADSTYSPTTDVLLGTALVSDQIPAGGSSPIQNASFALPTTVPDGFTESGTFYLFMQTDSPGNAVETNEANNTPTSADSLQVVINTSPDLEGSLLTVPPQLCWNQTFTLQYAVQENNNIAATGDVQQAFYLSKDRVFGNADDILLTTATFTSNLSIDEVQRLQFSAVPDSGTYTLTFDPDGSEAIPPLTTAQLGFSATAAEVQTALAALTTIGAGNVLVSGDNATGFTIAFTGFFPEKNVIDTALTVTGHALTSSGVPVTGNVTKLVDGVSNLSPTYTVQLTLPTDTPAGYEGAGPFYIGMATDSGNAVTESDEANNAPLSHGLGLDADSFLSISVDLYGALCDVPSTLSWGQPFRVDYQVGNAGSTPVTTDIQQTFYLSTDEVWGNADDLQLAVFPYTNNIPANGAGATQANWTQLPAARSAVALQFSATPAAGNYAISFDADGSGAGVAVTTASLAYSATAAQVQTALDALDVFGTNKVKVTGTYEDGFTITFADQKVSASQLTVTSNDFSNAGISGKLSDITQFYVLMQTDSGGAVGESNEVNDRPLSFGLGADADAFSIATDLPDLTGWQCYPPTKIEWGQAFLVNFQVANNGTAAATLDFQQTFYLSKDQIFGNGDDIVLGSQMVTVDVAAGGTTSMLAANLTLPASAPGGYSGTGPFYIGMYTDSGGAMWESNEVNNQPFTGGLGRDWEFFYIGQTTTPNTYADTPGLFDASASTFYLRSTNTSGAADYTFGYGEPDAGWILLDGDWDGNGTTGVGLYDPTSSTFYLTSAYVSGYAEYTFGYGEPNGGWIPLVGDWDGDGADGVGLYNPKSSTFYLTNALESGFAEYTFGFGMPGGGWQPLVGDWNGDGADGVALYNGRASTFYLTNRFESGYAEYTFGYGQAGGGWQPLVGDWDGDQVDGVGLFASRTSTFYLTNAFTTGYAQFTFGYGEPNAGWKPLVGDWNADGADGVGLYAPSSSSFYLTNSLLAGYAEYTIGFGQAGAGWLPFVGTWEAGSVRSATAVAQASEVSNKASLVNASAVDQIDLAAVVAQELSGVSTTESLDQDSPTTDTVDSALAIDLALAEL